MAVPQTLTLIYSHFLFFPFFPFHSPHPYSLTSVNHSIPILLKSGDISGNNEKPITLALTDS